jgi:hypothetical protein
MKLELQAFSYTVVHIPGSRNPADTLTRAPVVIAQLAVVVGSDGHARPAVEAAQPIAGRPPVVAQATFDKLKTTAELVEAQRADPGLQAYFLYIEKGEVPAGSSAGETKKVIDLAERMGLTGEGVLFIKANVPQKGEVRRGEGITAQLVVPATGLP